MLTIDDKILQWEDGLEIKPGYAYTGMPNEIYHRIPGVSASTLKAMKKSPAHARFKAKQADSRYREIGSAIHTAILEPALYAERYMTLEGITTRVASEYKQAAKVRGGEYVLTEPEGAKIGAMQEAIHSEPEASVFVFAPGWNEISFIAADPEHPDNPELWVKCRFDRLIKDSWIGWDLKKTQSAEPSDFGRSITNYEYHVQAVWYARVFEAVMGFPLQAFLFCAVEEESPNGVTQTLLPDNLNLDGERICNERHAKYRECVLTGHWPKYNAAPSTAIVPAYYARNIIEEASDHE